MKLLFVRLAIALIRGLRWLLWILWDRNHSAWVDTAPRNPGEKL